MFLCPVLSVLYTGYMIIFYPLPRNLNDLGVDRQYYFGWTGTQLDLDSPYCIISSKMHALGQLLSDILTTKNSQGLEAKNILCYSL